MTKSRKRYLQMMPEKKKEITYEELMSIHRQESRQKVLAKVSFDFYRQVAGYLEALEERCSKENETSSDISGMLLNQLRRAQEKSAEIYELRMRKIALMAMTSAFGAEPRLDNATSEEIEAFDSLKKFFMEHHERTLRPICRKKEELPKKIEGRREEGEKQEDAVEERQTEKPDTTPEGDRKETVIVRILENLPAFVGIDRNYQLMKEDVISLPKNIAEILLRHNKAVEIKHSL